MKSVVNWFKDPGHRRYVYRLAGAGSLVAVGYGWLTTEEAGLWLGFLGSALVSELAAQNVEQKGDHER